MALSDIPTQRSQQQILGQFIDSFTSRSGIRKLKIGNPILSIFETVSLGIAKSTYDGFKALNSKDIDNITGAALQKAGADEKLPQRPAIAATTTVNITDTSFNKISSNIYYGTPAPIVGSQTINVVKATTFTNYPSTGSIYIGRGTTRAEGPIAYSGIVNNTNYYTITLSSPTTSFHNQGEEVVIAQGGDRPVNVNQIISTPQGALSDPVQYTVLVPGVVLDGEVTLSNILVRCVTPGTIGNVPQGSIVEFGGTPPFSGATVTNPNPVTSGRNVETSQEYRDRIKRNRNTKQRGPELSILESVLNLTAPDEAKTVLSSSILKRYQKPSILYIDDGTGYEPISNSVGYEVLRSNATGGELEFATINSPILLASVESINTGPFALTSGQDLIVTTGGNTDTHYFDTSVFDDSNVATPYDICNSINSNPLLSFNARVTGETQKVTLFPKDDIINTIQVIGGEANSVLGFPTTLVYTSLLYKNDRLISPVNYGLDRAVGRLKLLTPLTTGDTLSIGSLWSKGFIESTQIDTFNLAADTNLWFTLDGNTTIVDTSSSSVSTLTVSIYQDRPSSLQLLVQNSYTFSSNVAIGQNLLLYQTINNSLPAGLEGVYKIVDKPASNQLVIEYPQMKAARKSAASANFTLSGNKVLICGGLCSHGTGVLKSAEIYNSDTHVFTQATDMNHARHSHTATLLGNGKILVAGGIGDDGYSTNSCEIYNPTTNTWTVADTLPLAVGFHSAILLDSGNVLVAGGLTGTTPDWIVSNASSEYNPTTDTWEHETTYSTARYSTTLIAMPDDNIFMLGGLATAPDLLNEDTDHTANVKKFSATLTCNIYDISGHSWSSATAVPEATTRTAYRNYTGALAAADVIVAVADNQYYTYSIAGNSWTNRGVIAAGSDVYNGTSSLNETAAISLAYSSLGRSNPLITTVNGTVVMAFAEVLITDTKYYQHYLYDTGTNAWVAFGVTHPYGAGRSFWTAVPSNTDDDEVIVFGGQQGVIDHLNLLESYDSESYVSANVDVLNTDDGTSTTYSLTGTYAGIQGWVVYNTTAPTVKVTIPADTGYIASGLVDNIDVDGGTAKTYKNSILRVSTNDNSGDITLVGPTLQELTQETLETSNPSTQAYIKSAKEIDIPFDFRLYQIGENKSNVLTIPIQQTTDIGTPEVTGGYLPLNGTIKGLYKKNSWEDSIQEAPYNWPSNVQGPYSKGFEIGNFKNEIARINQRDLNGSYSVSPENTIPDSTVVGIVSDIKITPNQAIYCGSPFIFNISNQLNTIVDQNTSIGNFTIKMSRKVKPSNSSYASLLTINDDENSNLSLAKKFGLDYSFNNFFVSMKARNKLNNILYRYYRFGADGENYVVKYEYSSTENADVSIIVDHNWKHEGTQYTDGIQKSRININLPTGDVYTESTLTPTTKLGLVAVNLNTDTRIADLYMVVGFTITEAERADIGGQTRLKVQLPSADLNTVTWFSANDFIRFDALTPTPTTLLSGQTRIVSVDAPVGSTQNIYIAEESLDDGTAALTLVANPGWISLDPSANELVQFDPNIALNDLAVLNIDGTTAQESLNANAFRITGLDTERQYLKCKAKILDISSFYYYQTIVSTSLVKFMESSAITETDLVTDINALDSIVSAKLIDTSTSISQATWDLENHWDAGSVLTDGLNAVLSTVNPLTDSNDYQINLKKDINSNLTTDSDFSNEEIYLLPAYAKDVVKWLNTPCITGLWTLSNITTANSGTSIQIESKTLGRSSSVQIAGTGANTSVAPVINTINTITQTSPTSYPNFIVTVDTTNADSFTANSMVKITNTNLTQKNYEKGSTINLTSITADGTFNFNTPPYTASDRVTTTGSIEKVGDSFAVIRLNSKVDNAWTDGTYPGDYIFINTPTYDSSTFTSLLSNVSNSNKGVFRIINISHNNSVIWVENLNAVTEKCVMDITFITGNSIIPGDILTIVSNNFNVSNKGSWTVLSVGESSETQFVANSLKVDVSNRSLTPVSASYVMNRQTIQALDGEPRVFYKKLIGINLNSDNSNYTDFVLCSNSNRSNPTLSYELDAISSAAGSVISSLNKLNFSTELQVGLDAYRYNTGLIGEAKKVLYGSEDDSTNYPGVVANGASVLIDGPIIKSIKIGFNVQITGNPSNDLRTKIQSAIASVINANPTGQNIIISNLTTAGGAVDSVVSIQALYNSDTILVSPSEKTKTLNLNDISINFIE